MLTDAINPGVAAKAIAGNIRRALHRRADIEAKNVAVVLEGSKVILKGKVRTWSERSEVENAAWCAPGVTEVKDEIEIEL